MQRVKGKGRRSWITSRRVLFASVVLAMALCTVELDAIERDGTVAGVRYRVIAPEWVWVGEVFNVLVVLDVDDGVESVDLDLDVPADGFEVKGGETSLRRSLSLAGEGGAHRTAFTGLGATRIDDAGRGFRFSIEVRDRGGAAGSRHSMSFTIRSVRGPVVRRGESPSEDWWSIGAQVGVALLAVPAFIVFLRRFSRKGAWRTVEPASIPETEDRWWNETS